MARREVSDAFGTSFLDLISCGLGSVTLLLVLFLARQGSAGGNSSGFCHARFWFTGLRSVGTGYYDVGPSSFSVRIQGKPIFAWSDSAGAAAFGAPVQIVGGSAAAQGQQPYADSVSVTLDHGTLFSQVDITLIGVSENVKLESRAEGSGPGSIGVVYCATDEDQNVPFVSPTPGSLAGAVAAGTTWSSLSVVLDPSGRRVGPVHARP